MPLSVLCFVSATYIPLPPRILARCLGQPDLSILRVPFPYLPSFSTVTSRRWHQYLHGIRSGTSGQKPLKRPSLRGLGRRERRPASTSSASHPYRTCSSACRALPPFARRGPFQTDGDGLNSPRCALLTEGGPSHTHHTRRKSA